MRINENGISMKNWIPTTISIVAIGFALVAIARVSPIQGDMDFDYYGAIIGVLAFLVTLLMGYQIYTVINVKEELKEVRKAREDINKKLEAKVQLSKEYRDELSQAAPIIMAIASQQRDIVESAAFNTYKKSKPEQFAREIATSTIVSMFTDYANVKDEHERHKRLNEISSNIQYDEAVEFFTDYAKKEDKEENDCVETLMLELLGILAEKKNEGDKN